MTFVLIQDIERRDIYLNLKQIVAIAKENEYYIVATSCSGEIPVDIKTKDFILSKIEIFKGPTYFKFKLGDD